MLISSSGSSPYGHRALDCAQGMGSGKEEGGGRKAGQMGAPKGYIGCWGMFARDGLMP